MKYLFVILLLFICFGAHSQSFDGLCVYSIKGKVTFSKGAIKDKEIIQNQFLNKEDVITVSKNSEIQLFNKHGNFMEITLPRKYNFSNLEQKINSNTKNPVTKMYLKLVYEKILNPDYDLAKVKQNSLASSYGGASRGAQCNSILFPPPGFKTSDSMVPFLWKAYSLNAKYNLNFYDKNQMKIASFVVGDTQQIFNINKISKQKLGRYYWDFYGLNANCDSDSLIFFEILSSKNMQLQIAKIKEKIKGESLTSQLDFISQLEAGGYINEANKNYEEVIKKFPENIILAESYKIFLLKYGIRN